MTWKVILIVLLVNIFDQIQAKNQTNNDRNKRSAIRATLAEKLDPNFWPTRGRRSEEIPEKNVQKLLQFLKAHRFVLGKVVTKEKEEEREDRESSQEGGPFWANRGRSIDLEDVRAKERGTEGEDEPFWANRGRALQEEEPFWANRGRAIDENDGPFWANRGRSLNSAEEGPFWANRGRRESRLDMEDTRWRRQPLYVEEPRVVWLSRREGISPFSESKDDPFFVMRGKRNTQAHSKRNNLQQNYWPTLLKKDTQNMVRALNEMNEDPFWPVRGKRGQSNDTNSV